MNCYFFFFSKSPYRIRHANQRPVSNCSFARVNGRRGFYYCELSMERYSFNSTIFTTNYSQFWTLSPNNVFVVVVVEYQLRNRWTLDFNWIREFALSIFQSLFTFCYLSCDSAIFDNNSFLRWFGRKSDISAIIFLEIIERY